MIQIPARIRRTKPITIYIGLSKKLIIDESRYVDIASSLCSELLNSFNNVSASAHTGRDAYV